MTKTLTAAGTIGAALVVAAAMFACGGRTDTIIGGDGGSGSGGGGSGGSGSGGSSSGLPPGPSCSGAAFGACFSCIENACPSFDCIKTDCSEYLQCACACQVGDNACQSSCQQSSTTAACSACESQFTNCPGVQGCVSQCSMTGSSGGGGGSGGFGSSSGPGGSGGFGSSTGGSSSGPGSSETCSGSGQQCANGGSLQFCQDFSGSTCTSSHYQIVNGNITEGFGCASCTDTTACQQAAMQACGQ
jgi:hypothetical protein